MSLGSDDRELMRLAGLGDASASDALFARHRERLKRCVGVRQDPRLRGRFDPSDVLQEAFFEASRRLGNNPPPDSMSAFVWLRLLAIQKLLELTRRHRSAMRCAGREALSIDQTDSAILAHYVAGAATTPARKAEKQELIETLKDLLAEMNEQDRQLLVLRHIEQLSNSEAAAVMAMNPSTASSSYLRALVRLRERMASLNLSWDGK